MDVEQRCNILRQELKGWEKQFTVQHDGRKAGRDDIKADAVICMHATLLENVMNTANVVQRKSTRNTTSSAPHSRPKLKLHPRHPRNGRRAAKLVKMSRAHPKRSYDTSAPRR
jgi:hypothetical protein